ncbi:transcriptional repressor [Salinibacterium sp. SYSU T00001]|uniref:Fur family transcriptional regulator n=1 Tax=Homoserinimonas sedimenticola TaxID=2986805 RepID=UPI0022355C5A|nr:Fur family transcriptional regulator [Salinibacterium sedimenticola]MCW4385524.1 transcriptional repressor [Salinibacterium sedimenticola]
MPLHRVKPDEHDLAAQIRGAGLKVTEPRIAAMHALEQAPHSDAEQVFGAVSEHLPTTSLQAIYGVLAALTSAGLVRKIEPAGSNARYELQHDDNHHHVVCRECGAVADIDCAVGHAPCLTPSGDHGFAVEQAEVTFWGLCPSCQTTVDTTPESTITKENL